MNDDKNDNFQVRFFMKTKIIVLLVAVALGIAGCSRDDKKETGLKLANNTFQDGEYEEALAQYEGLIETEGATAQVGAAWCYIRLEDYVSANTYFSLAADDSLIDGYAGWAFTSWALNNSQIAIDRANFVIRKNAEFTFSLDSRITANHLIWIQAASYYQLGSYSGSVEKIKLLDPAFNPDLNASNIAQLIAEKLQTLGAVHF